MSNILIALSSVVDALRHRGLVFNDPATSAKPKIVGKETHTSGPIDVRVISMPKRKTKGTVERDQDGNIRETTQLEQDAN